METNPTITALRELLDDDIRKFINAEAQLKSSLVVWANKARTLPLKVLLQRYLQSIEDHIEMLDAYASAKEISVISISNRIMNAYIDETDAKLTTCSLSDVRDASILTSVQSICHFKICAYGTAVRFANLLSLREAAQLFRSAELNEKNMNQQLSFLVEQHIAKKAKSPTALPL